MFRYVLTAALALSAATAFANDSIAELGTGGLILSHIDAVAMESADLIISPEKVTVDYVFRDVKKMGPTTFEMTGKDFYPERDIDILLLELSDDSVGGEGGYGG